jgi:hypothetical protein
MARLEWDRVARDEWRDASGRWHVYRDRDPTGSGRGYTYDLTYDTPKGGVILATYFTRKEAMRQAEKMRKDVERQ